MSRNKKFPMSKKKSQEAHFIKSCINRLGTIIDNNEIVRIIQKGELELIDKESSRISRFKYVYNDNEYMIVYDRKRKQAVTIIPYSEGYGKKCYRLLFLAVKRFMKTYCA